MSRYQCQVFFLVVFSLVAMACSAQFPVNKLPPSIEGEIRVTIRVVDEAGDPVPYATLWSRYAWDATHLSPLERVHGNDVPMEQAALVRIARRHQSEFDAFHAYDFPLYWVYKLSNYPTPEPSAMASSGEFV